MRTLVGWGLLGVLLLSACQQGIPTRKTFIKPAAKATTPATKPAAGPASAATPAAKPAGLALSGLVQVDASYVIAAGGGNVIAAGGGNVIAAGGGNVIAAGGGNFRTLALDVAIGQILPVKGMQVQAIAMMTGEPYGEAVLSDEQGGFEVAVPEGTTDNVLLVAKFPGLEDQRLIYPLVVSPTAEGQRRIDEDTATVTRYMRRSMMSEFAGLMTAEGIQGDFTTLLQALRIPAAVATLAKPALTEFQEACKARKTHELSAEARERISQRFTDVLLAKVKLADVAIAPTPAEAGEPAIAAMVDIMRQTRVAVAKKMAEDPAYFAKQAYVKAASRPWELKKPTDLGEFIVGEYLTNQEIDSLGAMRTVFDNVGVPVDQVRRLARAGDTIGVAMGMAFVVDSRARKLALEAIQTVQAD